MDLDNATLLSLQEWRDAVRAGEIKQPTMCPFGENPYKVYYCGEHNEWVIDGKIGFAGTIRVDAIGDLSFEENQVYQILESGEKCNPILTRSGRYFWTYNCKISMNFGK